MNKKILEKTGEKKLNKKNNNEAKYINYFYTLTVTGILLFFTLQKHFILIVEYYILQDVYLQVIIK